jgi:Nickel responsive protein SCO4226-like
MSSDKPEDR